VAARREQRSASLQASRLDAREERVLRDRWAALRPPPTSGSSVSEQDSLLALAGWFAYGMDGACSLPAWASHDGHRAAAARELSGRSRKVVEKIIQTFRDTGSLYTT